MSSLPTPEPPELDSDPLLTRVFGPMLPETPCLSEAQLIRGFIGLDELSVQHLMECPICRSRLLVAQDSVELHPSIWHRWWKRLQMGLGLGASARQASRVPRLWPEMEQADAAGRPWRPWTIPGLGAGAALALLAMVLWPRTPSTSYDDAVAVTSYTQGELNLKLSWFRSGEANADAGTEVAVPPDQALQLEWIPREPPTGSQPPPLFIVATPREVGANALSLKVNARLEGAVLLLEIPPEPAWRRLEGSHWALAVVAGSNIESMASAQAEALTLAPPPIVPSAAPQCVPLKTDGWQSCWLNLSLTLPVP